MQRLEGEVVVAGKRVEKRVAPRGVLENGRHFAILSAVVEALHNLVLGRCVAEVKYTGGERHVGDEDATSTDGEVVQKGQTVRHGHRVREVVRWVVVAHLNTFFIAVIRGLIEETVVQAIFERENGEALRLRNCVRGVVHHISVDGCARNAVRGNSTSEGRLVIEEAYVPGSAGDSENSQKQEGDESGSSHLGHQCAQSRL